MLSREKPLVKPMAPGSLFHIIKSRLHLASFRSSILQSFTFRSINQKYQKYLLYHLSISIRSHFCKWPWRDWQPIYRVGCEVLVCLCRYERLACSLLLDWYLDSQKLREILTLLCCITLSSSRENQRMLKRQQEGFLAPLPGRSTPSQDIPSTHW